MNLKENLLEYFNQKEVPDELDPELLPSFVKPKTVLKKSVSTASAKAPATLKNQEDFHTAPENASPKIHLYQEKEDKKSPDETIPEKPQKISLHSNNYYTSEQSEQPNKYSSESHGESHEKASEEHLEIGASAFIKVVFYHKLTRKEFLNLLGNTKISNHIFQQIESNPGLTVKELINILESSSLTSDDYKRLIIVAERTAQLKKDAVEKLQTESSDKKEYSTPSPIAPALSSKPKINLNELTSPKTQEMHPIKEHTPDRAATNEFSLGVDDDDDDTDKFESGRDQYIKSKDSEGDEKNEKEKPKRKLLFGGVSEDDEVPDDFDEDEIDKNEKNKSNKTQKNHDRLKKRGEDYDDDDDDEYGDEEKPRSNKGKFIIAAVGALVLICLAFGIHYFMTGSLLPNFKPAEEEIELSEQIIFDKLTLKSDSAIKEYNPDPQYTIGGIAPENPIKHAITTDRRLMYIRDNSLYIFELIGGQAEQLYVRSYPSEVRLLGLVQTNEGIAVISCNDGQPYNFVRTMEAQTQSSDAASAPQTVEDSVTRPETVVELLQKDAPENPANAVKYRLSGTLSDIFSLQDKLIILTDENIPQNCYKDDYATFMPYAVTSDGKKLCSKDNSYLSKNPRSRSITAVFSLNCRGDASVACMAGDLAKTAAVSEGLLYIGAGDRLVCLSCNEGLAEKGHYSFDGTFEDFSEISFYTDNATNEKSIRMTVQDETVSLIVLNYDFELVNHVKNLCNKEAAAATCFYNGQTYIVTETGVCYGIDANFENITGSTLKISSSKIYNFPGGGNAAIGIKITPTDENGKRTGIKVASIKLDGTESELSSAIINSKTVAKNSLDEYLSSPAETDLKFIGSKAVTDSENGVVVIPIIYFDGVSEVEMFAIYSVSSDGAFFVNGAPITEYDIRSKYTFALVKDDYVIAVTDKKIITAKASDGSIAAYCDIVSNPSGGYNYW